MIAPSTDFDAFVDAVRSLAASPDYHYIKHAAIVDKIDHNGRIFYTRYSRVDSPLTPALIRDHLNGIRTLALPLSHDGQGSTALFLYDGEAPEHFVRIFEHLIHTRGITDYRIFHGATDLIRLIALHFPRQPITSLYRTAKDLSDQLETATTKNWKILPDPSLPTIYNTIPLPYS